MALKRWQTPEPAAVRRADALRVLAETTLAHGPAARPGADRYQVVVVVRADTLTGDQPPARVGPAAAAAGADRPRPGVRPAGRGARRL